MSFNRFASHGVLFRCPFQHNYRFCPLDKLRKLSVEERVEHLKTLTLEQLNNLEIHYNNCVKESRKIRNKKKP